MHPDRCKWLRHKYSTVTQMHTVALLRDRLLSESAVKASIKSSVLPSITISPMIGPYQDRAITSLRARRYSI